MLSSSSCVPAFPVQGKGDREFGLLLLLIFLITTPLAAQFDTTTVAGRVFQRRIDALDQDSTIKAFADQGGLSYGTGLSASNFGRVNDQGVVLFARLLSRAIERLNPEDCAALLASTDGGDDFWLYVSRTADSLEAEAWAGLLAQLIWSEVEQRPVYPTASKEETQQVLIVLVRHATGKEQATLITAAGTDDACRLAPWLLDRLVAKRPEHSAPLIRGFMAGSNSD